MGKKNKKRKKKKTSKRGAHTRPALSEAEKPNLACKVKKKSEEERNLQLLHYLLNKERPGAEVYW